MSIRIQPRSSKLSGLFIAIAALVTPFLALPAEDLKRPNILFILTDDCGWSDTTLYGTTRFYETPNIERLAQRGLRFSQAYAYPMCTPSRTRTDAIFSCEDFYPTLLAALGVKPFPDQKFDGLNQFPTLLGNTPASVRDRDLCFFPHYDPEYATIETECRWA